MVPEPNYKTAINFLKEWAPDGPWILTTIEVDQKGITTKTFHKGDTSIAAWLAQQGATRNIYYHVNPTMGDLTSKARREDVKELAWLHVDLDPEAGEDIDEERARMLALLQDPPGDIPPATRIHDSGGGYQGFWKLLESFMINGDLALAEEAMRWNLQLELLFHADSCHSVDHVMRLPGTLNRPNAKKRKRGQQLALAQVVEWHPERVYDLAQFTKAPAVQGPASEGFTTHRIQVPGNIPRLNDVEDLGDDVSDYCKMLIVQGEDPDEPTKYPSKSEVLFRVCCDLVRAGVSDEKIYGVITDPEWGISKSVLDKGAGVERYAIKQIETARDEAIDPWLRKLNEKHAVISDIGDKCRIVSEVYDSSMKRTRISKQTFEDFRNRYMNKYVEVESKKDKQGNKIPQFAPVGKWWLNNPHRRQFETLIFAPGQDDPDAYNLWRGFSCEARPGDCSLFLEHVRKNVCGENEEHYNYLLGWMARAIQKPGSQGHAAIVMRGKEGIGKGFFAEAFGSLWGCHFLHVANSKHLTGNFNAHLRDCSVLFGDEAFWAGDKEHESVLKTLVTEKTVMIEPKHVNAEMAPNRIKLIMASNADWVVPAGPDARRYFVLDVGDMNREDHSYFEKIQAQLDSGGREALLHFLTVYDISNFNVREVPKTDALNQQKQYSFTTEEDWWYTKLCDGRLQITDDGWVAEIPCAQLIYDFFSYTRQFTSGRRTNSTRLGCFLKKICPGDFPERQQRTSPVEALGSDGKTMSIPRPWWYVFPPLEECRDFWVENYGRNSWPSSEVINDDEGGL